MKRCVENESHIDWRRDLAWAYKRLGYFPYCQLILWWNRCHIPARAPTKSLAWLHRSTILSPLGLDHTFTVLFLGTHMKTSQGWGLVLIPNCHILAWAPTTSQAQLHHSTILSTLGPDHALTVLFLRTHTRTFQRVTHYGIALARTRLTSEFLWNPNPVSSQKTSCSVEMRIYI